MENNLSNTAFVNGTGKVHFSKKLSLSSRPINYEFNRFYYREILKLLANVFEETIVLPELKVYKILKSKRLVFRKAISIRFLSMKALNPISGDSFILSKILINFIHL